jgi:hypothetical protein
MLSIVVRFYFMLIHGAMPKNPANLLGGSGKG